MGCGATSGSGFDPGCEVTSGTGRVRTWFAAKTFATSRQRVLTHRLITTFAAQAEGFSARDIVERLLAEGPKWPSEQQRPRFFGSRRCWQDWRVLPLMARRPMRGSVSGKHISPNAWRECRVCGVPQVRSRRRSAAIGLACPRTQRSLLCQRIRSRHESAVLFGGRYQRFDGIRLGGDVSKLQYARQIAAAIAYLAVQQGDAVGLSCVAECNSRALADPAQSVAPECLV